MPVIYTGNQANVSARQNVEIQEALSGELADPASVFTAIKKLADFVQHLEQRAGLLNLVSTWTAAQTFSGIKDADRPVALVARSTAQSLTANAENRVAFDVVQYDPFSMVSGLNTTSFKFTVPPGQGGLYRVSGRVGVAPGASAQGIALWRSSNATGKDRRGQTQPSTAEEFSLLSSALILLDAGTDIFFNAYVGGNARALIADSGQNYVAIEKILSPL